MAKVDLPSEIESLSGALGSVIFRTFTKRDGTKETHMYRNPYYKLNGRGGYQRATKPTKKECASRQRFAQMSRAVTARIKAGDKRTRKEIWKEVKQKYGTTLVE